MFFWEGGDIDRRVDLSLVPIVGGITMASYYEVSSPHSLPTLSLVRYSYWRVRQYLTRVLTCNLVEIKGAGTVPAKFL